LRFLGITTIGAFAALPYADVLVRYGTDAAQAHLLARGLDPTLLQPRQLGDPPLAEQLFEPPESRLEPLVFAIKRHLDRLCGELQVGGWICGSLTIRCTCDEGDTLVETCRPAEPTANAARLTDLLRWRLEQRQTEALQTGASLFASGLTKLTIQLDDLSPSQAQAVSLFTAERSGKRNVIAAVERLEALLGPEAVRTAVLTKGRRPDQAFTWAPFRPTFTDPARQRVPRRLPARKQPIASTRVQPLPLDTIPDGRASLLDGGGATHAVPAMRILEPPHQVKVQQRDTTIASLSAGRGVEAVARVSGPWKVAEQWWAQAGERDYFQVWTRLGRLYLLYREAENWFVQGVFD
jgi:protein ImuB